MKAETLEKNGQKLRKMLLVTLASCYLWMTNETCTMTIPKFRQIEKEQVALS